MLGNVRGYEEKYSIEEYRELGVIVILGMYKFSSAAITNYHKCNGLK